MKPQRKITQQEVQAALKKFRRAGGLIRRLPEQVAPRRASVASGVGQDGIEALLARMEPLN